MVLKHCSGTVSFAILVTFTCLLLSFGELCPVGEGPLTSCLQPAVSQLPLFTDWMFPVPLCQASRRLLWLRAANLKWPTAAVTVSFSETIYKAPVPFCCRPSLGFPLQPLPAPSHHPFQLMAFYLPVIWLLCLSLAAWQSAESGSERRAECLGCSWLLLWLQNGTTTCWISDVQSARQ